MRRWAITGAVVVLLAGLVFVVRPFLALQRDTPAEIPSPAAIYSTDVVPLERGKPVCFDDAVVEHHAERIRYRVSAPEVPAPAMSVKITGPGYDATAEIPAGLLDGQTAEAAIPRPPGDVPVRVCIHSRGDAPVGLFASSDRSRSRSIATIDGKPVVNPQGSPKSVWFAFHEPRFHSIVERVPATIDRMTVFRPGYVGVVLLWAIAILFLVGTPIAIVWAYVRALREDGEDDLSRVDVNARRAWWRRLVD